MKLKPETLLLVAAEFAVAAVGGYGLRQGVNRANQALERIAAASEASSRPPLPRPSLLHRAGLKPVPVPDPEPCDEYGYKDATLSCDVFGTAEQRRLFRVDAAVAR